MKTAVRKSIWWSVLAGIVVGGIAGAIAYKAAGDDIGKLGDWTYGAQRFIGMVATIGLALGFLVTLRLTRGVATTRTGYRLSYGAIDPTADGYRDMKTVTVADLVAKLREVGYEPRIEACNELGERSGSIDNASPLAGVNVAVSDPRVRGWIRLELAKPAAEQQRALGVLEISSEGGESAEQLGLFTLRGLDSMVRGLTAAHDDSQLSEDPVSLLTAGLAERPSRR